MTADSAVGSSGLPTFVRTAPPAQNSASASSNFSAFQGRGVALGGVIPTYSGPSSVRSNTSTASTSSQKSSSNLAGKSTLVDTKQFKVKSSNDSVTNTTMGEDLNEGHPISHNEGQ